MDTQALTGVDPSSATATQYSVKVLRLSQDQTQAEGKAALELIQSATPPPDPEGRGQLLDTFA